MARELMRGEEVIRGHVRIDRSCIRTSDHRLGVCALRPAAELEEVVNLLSVLLILLV